MPPHQDFNHVNGNLTAVHETCRGHGLTRQSPSIRRGPWEGADLKDWDTNVPEKILHATVEIDGATRELDLWNIRAIPGSMHGEEKIKILRNTSQRIRKGCQPPCLLTGDFNAPDRELADGTLIPWRTDQEGAVAERWVEAERNVLRGLEELGMVDTFRAQHGYGALDVLDVIDLLPPLKGWDSTRGGAAWYCHTRWQGSPCGYSGSWVPLRPSTDERGLM